MKPTFTQQLSFILKVVCAQCTLPPGLVWKCRNECFFYGEILHFSFCIICSSQQIFNYTLSAVAGTFFFFFLCSIKKIWLLAKPAFTQHTSFILKVVANPTHLASWVGVEACAWPVWCSTPFIFFIHVSLY